MSCFEATGSYYVPRKQANSFFFRWLRKFVYLSGSHVTVRPSVLPSTPPSTHQGKQCTVSQFLTRMEACNLLLHTRYYYRCSRVKSCHRIPQGDNTICLCNRCNFMVNLLYLPFASFVAEQWRQKKPNAKTLKIAQNTIFQAKGRQFTLGKVIHVY